MALTEPQQLQKLFETSKYILILFNSHGNGDATATALALKSFFEKQHKQIDIVGAGFTLPKNLHFLPGADSIKPELSHLQKFILKVDVSKAPIDTISYDVKDGWLSIYLTPKHGILSKQELRTAQSTFKYDLIITINTPDLESLGEIFFNNTDLFYRTNILNIDHQPSNERYGQINLVDLTATSAAEIVYRTLKQMSENHIDGAIATALLTGMTLATNSFKNQNVTPLTLQTASQLINSGAEREKVIQHLYRTRSIATLRLWGQALSRLQNDPKLGLVWTTITREDFTRSGGTTEDVSGIVEELISNSPEAKITLVLYEIDATNKIGGIVTVDKSHDALELTKAFHPQGSKRQATFILEGKTLTEAETAVIKLVRETITH